MKLSNIVKGLPVFSLVNHAMNYKEGNDFKYAVKLLGHTLYASVTAIYVCASLVFKSPNPHDWVEYYLEIEDFQHEEEDLNKEREKINSEFIRNV